MGVIRATGGRVLVQHLLIVAQLVQYLLVAVVVVAGLVGYYLGRLVVVLAGLVRLAGRRRRCPVDLCFERRNC